MSEFRHLLHCDKYACFKMCQLKSELGYIHFWLSAYGLLMHHMFTASLISCLQKQAMLFTFTAFILCFSG